MKTVDEALAATAQEDAPLFTSEDAKQEGMKRAADAQPELLARARAEAKKIAIARGSVTADDVVEAMGLSEVGPWMGSVFKGDEWRFTGERIRSRRVANHARELKVWRLK